jgi:PAS domain S-box-containing protein
LYGTINEKGMIKNINVSTKITLLILAITLVAISAISFFSYDYQRKTVQEKNISNLTALADNYSAFFSNYFERAATAVQILQHAPAITSNTSAAPPSDGGIFAVSMDTMDMPADDTVPAEAPLEIPETGNSLEEFIKSQKSILRVDDIIITSPTGSVVASTDPKIKGNFLDADQFTFSKAKSNIYFTPVKRDKDKKRYYAYVAGTTTDSNGNDLLVLVKLNLAIPYKVLTNYFGLGESGEVILVQKDPVTKKFALISPLRSDTTSSIKLLPEENPFIAAISPVFEAKLVSSNVKDYRDKEVLQVSLKINAGDIALIAKMDLLEASAGTKEIMNTFFYSGVCISGLAILMAMVFSRSLTRPLFAMRNTLNLVAQGILPEVAENRSKDEFGQMGAKVDHLVQTLRSNADFAKRIGEGKYDTEFKPASDDDILGMSLLTMRKNLIENERRDTERNWIVRGVAEISEILRMHDAIDQLGDDVIKFIIGKIGAVQGAFYVVNDESTPHMIEMRASFAYNRKKYLKAKFKFAEGLVGQAAIEKDTILRTEVPDDFVTLTSGILGDQKPSCILIVPLITNEEVYGVLEFAAFKKFDTSQVNFVQELSLILARTIFNIKVNERTRRLLAESQAMSNELKEKQEVLRQNAEEMQATQEELKRSNQMLEEQVEEVNRTQKRMQLLLENASEVITIYEEDETIRYISPSVETILGYGQKEMIGKSDMEKVQEEHRNIFKDLFKKMTTHPDEKVTVQYEYRAKDGSFIWLESTGTNCMSNPAIHGFILNSRDITERRRAEQEQRMRSKMQALSENSPDLITRLEGELISYINPVIEEYTGKKPHDFLNKKVKDVELDFSILEGWLKVVEKVNESSKTVSTEMDFPSEMGKRVMQVNAIPEFDETNKLESVLVVSHDITDRKMIELEIQNKNKKITESINYAKRIQTAILPNSKVISRAIPDSFILYKPRDVVSGDFPWFVQIKDEIFIAAMDCTGHGVPGALLSLIGYFLLNDIVRSRKITEPGIILDLLDEGVTTTLRQDEDSTTKDGMDIALCKININSGEVEYAGAHRPLYIIKGGLMEEVKGNKFPIGGGIFKNQTNFTNTKIKLSKGDSIYFSSDGFPDQFGGPEARKFGPKKVRDIIDRVHKLPMEEAIKVFDHEWENWRGEHKQTDDVLLIGIKF